MSGRRRSYSRSPGRYRNRGGNRNYKSTREIRPIAWDSLKLSGISNCSSALTEAVHEHSLEEAESFRRDHEIKISPEAKVALSFGEIRFPECIETRLKELNWHPHPIQAQCLPILMEGHDLFVNAKTGTGKALSFILAVISTTLEQIKHKNNHDQEGHEEPNEGKGPISLVLVPTREIAEYIEYTMLKFSSGSGLLVSAIFGGGGSRSFQRESVENNPHIIIATPGRLMDFLESAFVDLKTCKMLVLYETDRMLDMGFESKIKTISTQIRPDRHAVIFTSRVTQDVDYVVKKLSNKPYELVMGHRKIIGNQKVHQTIEILTPARKLDKLIDLCKRIDRLQAFIFVETIRGADYLKQKLRDKKFYVGSIHVEKSSKEREETFEKLKSGSLDVVVSTELASRGLDLTNINNIINYDYPPQTEDYVNRLVRVCRSDSKVSFYSFFHTRNGKLAKELIKVLDDSREKIPEQLKRISREGYISGNRRRYRYSYSSSRSPSRSPRGARRPIRGKSHSFTPTPSRSASSASRSVSSSSSRSHSNHSRTQTRSLSKSIGSCSSRAASIHNGKSPSAKSSRSSSSRAKSRSVSIEKKMTSRSVSPEEPAAKIARTVVTEKLLQEEENLTNQAKSQSIHSKSRATSHVSSHSAKSHKSESPDQKSSSSRSRSKSKSKSKSRSKSKTSSRSSSRSLSHNRKRNYRGRIRSKSPSESVSRSRSRSSQPPRRRRRSSRSYSRRRRSPSYRGRIHGGTRRYSRHRSPSYRRRSPVRRYYRTSPSNRRRTPPRRRERYSSFRSRSRSRRPRSPTRSPIVEERSSDLRKSSVTRRSLSVQSNRSEKPDTPPKAEKKKSKSKKKKDRGSSPESGADSSSEEKESKKSKKKKKKKSKKKKSKKAKSSAADENGASGGEEKKAKKKKKKASSPSSQQEED